MAPCLVDSLAVANIWPLFGIGMCHAHVVRRRCAGPFCPFRCFPRKGVGVPLLFGETLRCGLLYSVTESGIKPANRVFRQVCFWQVARCVHFVLLHHVSESAICSRCSCISCCIRIEIHIGTIDRTVVTAPVEINRPGVANE